MIRCGGLGSSGSGGGVGSNSPDQHGRGGKSGPPHLWLLGTHGVLLGRGLEKLFELIVLPGPAIEAPATASTAAKPIAVAEYATAASTAGTTFAPKAACAPAEATAASARVPSRVPVLVSAVAWTIISNAAVVSTTPAAAKDALYECTWSSAGFGRLSFYGFACYSVRKFTQEVGGQ